MSGKIITEFQEGEHTGLVAVIVCAALSLIAINFVWIRMVFVAVRKSRKPDKVSKFMPETVFFRTQLGAYIASLLLSNAISCVGSVINVTWFMQGGITLGGLCTLQGALIQVGDLATAYFTAAIAVHTFCTLALKNRLPFYCAWIAIVVGWLLTGVSGIVPAMMHTSSGPIFGTDGATCGISLGFPAVQLLLHLVPVLVASLIASVFYAMVFLNVRGTLTIRGGVRFNLDPEARWRAQDGQMEYVKFVAAIARSMLIFPIAYVVLMTPHIVICIVETSGWQAPFSAKVFAVASAALLGVFNILILYNTLRIMGPGYFNHPSSQQKDVESFSTPEKSPVDVAPSVSAVLAQRAFPPPRSMSSRQGSIASTAAESTAHLLPPRVGHGYSNSDASSATLTRSITPVEELNEMIVPNAPMTPRIKVDSASSDSDDSSVSSLPAPRRPGLKQPHLRRPSVPAAIQVPARSEYVVENGMLSAVNLKSGGPKKTTPKTHNRDSFISMYTTQSPPQHITVQGPSPPHRTVRPSASTGNFGERYDMSAFTSPRAVPTPSARSSTISPDSSPDVYSARPVLDLPLSPFAAGLIERAARSPEHSRTRSDLASPMAGSMSAREATMTDKRHKRRSKSLDVAPRRGIPEVLRPGTPLSARAKEILPNAIGSPADFGFPQTPRTPHTPARPSRLRSPAPPLPASPQPSVRRLPKTPTQTPSAARYL